MVSPVDQGTINRLRQGVVFADFADLSITAPYLGKSGVSISFRGPTGQLLPTLTGAVRSSEPYVMAEVTMHLLKSQVLSAAFKTAMELNSNVGSVSVIGDADTLPAYNLENCILTGVDALDFGGTSADFVVKLEGIYYVNRTIWNAS